jgi:RNA polymerase sigma-70 factor (ECF subfamily)
VRAETAERVRAALLRLPPEKREVLVLSRYELLRYEEIAGMLGCSVGAVKLRVHRALKDLRRMLGPEAAPAAGLGGLP